MGHLTVIVGRSGTGKTRQMVEQIKKETDGTHIIITPDQCSHQLEREICAIAGPTISLNTEVLTFSRLCQHVFNHSGGIEDPELTKEGRVLVLYRSVEEAKKNGMKVLSSYSHQPIFYEKLLKTVDELKSNQVSTDTLYQVGQSNEKIKEIALICGYYDCFTQSFNENQDENIQKALGIDKDTLETDFLPENQVLFDPRDRLTRAAERLADDSMSFDHTVWGKGKTFWLDGFVDFTPQQLKIIRCLLEQGEKVTVNLLGDVAEVEEVLQGALIDFEEQLFAPMLKTASILKDLQERTKSTFVLEPVKEAFQVRNQPLAHVERYLFANKKAEFEGDVGETLHVMKAETTRSEVEWMASEILKLVKEQGYRYRDIMVVARNFSSYQSNIQSIFKRYEIPFFMTKKTNIMEKPVISVVNTVFQVVNYQFNYLEMFRYLKTGFANLSQKDVDLLEEYVLLWGISGKQWKKPFEKHPDSFSGVVKKGDGRLEYLEKLRQKVMEPFLLLPKSDEVCTVAEHCEKLYAFVKTIKLYEKMQYRKENYAKENDLLQSQEYAQLWEILCRCLEQCHRLLGECSMDFKEFSKVFHMMLSQCSVSAIPATLDQVMVGEVTRLKHRRSKVVIWLGAEDSVVPTMSNSGGLFTDADRKVLEEVGDEEGSPVVLNQSEEKLLYRETTTAYEICALASEKLYFSYGKLRDKGGKGTPCFFVEHLLEMFGEEILQNEPENGAFRLLAPAAALEHSDAYPFVTEVLSHYEKWKVLAENVEQSKRWHWEKLSEEGVAYLYGDHVTLSATRVQTINSCAFMHFMNYGIKARPRKLAEFDALEYGTFIHSVLETLLSEKNRVGHQEVITFNEVERMMGKVLSLLKQYLENQGTALEDNARSTYLFKRLENDITFMVMEACEELNASKFAYLRGEEPFLLKEEDLFGYSPRTEGIKLSYKGTIDRIDGWAYEGEPNQGKTGKTDTKGADGDNVDDNDGNGQGSTTVPTNYIRVIDYKTGKKSWSLQEFFMGLQVQLPLYYMVALLKGPDIFKSDDLYDEAGFLMTNHKKNPCDGAGFCYFPAREVVVSGQSWDSLLRIKRTQRSELKRKGAYPQKNHVIRGLDRTGCYVPAVYKNEDDFYISSTTSKDPAAKTVLSQKSIQLLLDAVKQNLWQLSDSLGSGFVGENPYKLAKDTPCKYCDYKKACFFEEGSRGENYRKGKETKPLVRQCVKHTLAPTPKEKKSKK